MVRDSYVWGLVFLRLGVVITYVFFPFLGGYFLSAGWEGVPYISYIGMGAGRQRCRVFEVFWSEIERKS